MNQPMVPNPATRAHAVAARLRYREACEEAATATTASQARWAISRVVLGLYHVVGTHLGIDTTTPRHAAVLTKLTTWAPWLAPIYARLEEQRVAALEDVECDLGFDDLDRALADSERLLAALHVRVGGFLNETIDDAAFALGTKVVGLVVEHEGYTVSLELDAAPKLSAPKRPPWLASMMVGEERLTARGLTVADALAAIVNEAREPWIEKTP